MSAVTGGIKLSNGAIMPSIGIGTWLVTGESAMKEVEWALDAGYRSIDTAAVYGNETEVGKAIQNQILVGNVSRQDIFVTTKGAGRPEDPLIKKCEGLYTMVLRSVPVCSGASIVNAGAKRRGGEHHCFWPTNAKRREDVTILLTESLQKLKLDYVDLYLQHKPEMQGSASNTEIWKGLEDVHRAGLAKAIGVSTFSTQQLQHLIENAETKPHNVQNKANLYSPDTDAFEFCKRHNISYTAFSPLGNPSWSGNAGKPNPMQNAVVKQIALTYNKSAAQILLRHLLQRGMAVIPKSEHKERIIENFNVLDFYLTDEDMAKLNAVAASG